LRIKKLEKTSTDNEESHSFSRDLVERFLYGLATLLFCTAPFLIPGISMRYGFMFFFAEIIILILGVIVFSKVVNRKKVSGKSRKSSH
jgi:hypothetical protein